MENMNRIMALSQMNVVVDFATVVREAGETMQQYIDHLNSAADAFDEAFSELNEAIEMDV